ncbi:MAG: membrane protein of unknown function [Promethearchaeota archaeon]|jgi:hypothetical protein|nr:MAG: membrane protein of unknown function [Candidatus Lokiarchaeota archaeon]
MIIQFVIEGALKDVIIVVEWITFFLLIELSFLLWRKLREKEKKLDQYGDRGFLFLFLGYSFMWFFIVIADHYISSPSKGTLILTTAFSIGIFGAFLFIFLTERKTNFYKKFLFSSIYIILFLIFIILNFLDFQSAATFSTLFWVLFFIYMVFYIKRLKGSYYLEIENRRFKTDLIEFSIGILFVAIGYQLTTRLVVSQLNSCFRLMGDVFQIIGIVLLFLFFTSISSLSELHWKEKIESILLAHKSGLLIYNKNMSSEESYTKQSLKSGGIVGIEMILDNIISGMDYSIIQRDNKNIIVYSGDHLYGIIISDEVLRLHKLFLSKLVSRIETLYDHILYDWRGNLKVFSPIEDIVDDMLS